MTLVAWKIYTTFFRIPFNFSKEVFPLHQCNLRPRSRKRMGGLVDLLFLETSRSQKSKVVTGDDHFRDLKDEVIMII
jgi:hypothetical protein